MATQTTLVEVPQFMPRRTINHKLLDDVMTGMVFTTGHKSIPTLHLYSDGGMDRYNRICAEPFTEYYPIRAEEGLLQSKGMMDEILWPLFESLQDWMLYVQSLGPGNGHKDVLLLDHLIHRYSRKCIYAPVDVCASACARTSELITDFIGSRNLLSIDPRSNGLEFLDGLRAAQGLPMPRLITYFGSTFGNFAPPFNLGHLAGIADSMAKGNNDHLLMGVDMAPNRKRKPVSMVEAAYNTAPTKEWVMYLLDHLNEELSTGFRRQDFDYVSYYDGSLPGIRTMLVANREFAALIPCNDAVITFREGEELHVEVSMKYTDLAFKQLVAQAGLKIVSSVEDKRHAYRLILLCKA